MMSARQAQGLLTAGEMARSDVASAINQLEHAIRYEVANDNALRSQSREWTMRATLRQLEGVYTQLRTLYPLETD